MIRSRSRVPLPALSFLPACADFHSCCRGPNNLGSLCRYLMRVNTWWCAAMSFTITLSAGLLAMICLDRGPRSTHSPQQIRWLTVWSKDRAADQALAQLASSSASAGAVAGNDVMLKSALVGGDSES